MNIKHTYATNNRPYGNRIVDANYVIIDIDKYYKQLIEEEGWQKNDRTGITLFKTDETAIVLTTLHAGTMIPSSLSDEIIIIQVIDGLIELTLQGVKIPMEKRQLVVVHAGIQYAVSAIENATLIINTVKKC